MFDVSFGTVRPPGADLQTVGSALSDHEWAHADKHVGDATESQSQREQEEMSPLVCFCCDSGACNWWECIYSPAAQCESHYRPLTFMALVERCRASCVSHGWNECMCASTAVKKK